jgi:hypothetical protein
MKGKIIILEFKDFMISVEMAKGGRCGQSKGRRRKTTINYLNKSKTQTRPKLSWGEAIWGLTDQPMNQVLYRGAMVVPKKVGAGL